VDPTGRLHTRIGLLGHHIGLPFGDAN